MQEKNRNHRPQGAGLPPLHMTYTWWILPKKPMAMRQRKKAKHGRHRRHSKPRHNNTGTREDNPDGAEEEYDPDQPTFVQAEQEHGQASPDEQATDGYLEDDNYMPPSEDEVSLGDDEFGVPEDPIEQERFKRRLIATARSLKKKQQQLQVDQDLLVDRWTEVLAAEEYGLEPPHQGIPKAKIAKRRGRRV